MDLVNKIGFGHPIQLYNFILSNVKDIFFFFTLLRYPSVKPFLLDINYMLTVVKIYCKHMLQKKFGCYLTE